MAPVVNLPPACSSLPRERFKKAKNQKIAGQAGDTLLIQSIVFKQVYNQKTASWAWRWKDLCDSLTQRLLYPGICSMR